MQQIVHVNPLVRLKIGCCPTYIHSSFSNPEVGLLQWHVVALAEFYSAECAHKLGETGDLSTGSSCVTCNKLSQYFLSQGQPIGCTPTRPLLTPLDSLLYELPQVHYLS